MSLCIRCWKRYVVEISDTFSAKYLNPHYAWVEFRRKLIRVLLVFSPPWADTIPTSIWLLNWYLNCYSDAVLLYYYNCHLQSNYSQLEVSCVLKRYFYSVSLSDTTILFKSYLFLNMYSTWWLYFQLVSLNDTTVIRKIFL